MPATPGPPTLLQLLGSPRLLAGATALHVGSRKALAVLALLAMEGPMARERLAELLWPDAPGGDARRNLRRELFRLRGQGVVLHEQPDGALALEESFAVDAKRLLRGEYTPELAVRAMEGLDGLASPAFDDWLQAIRERLDRRWRQLLLARAQQAEASGDLEQALQCFSALHAADPLREITVRDLMRVHARLGERPAALSVFDQLVRRLRDELAVEPLPETQAMAQGLRDPGRSTDRGASALLLADAPAMPDAPAAAILPRLMPFVGRSGALQALQAAWRSGKVMVLEGEAGEGKSRLLAELLSQDGAYLHLACRPADTQQPFATAARLLRELLAAAVDVTLPEDVRHELARVLPELGPSTPLSSGTEQQSFLEACARAVFHLAHDNFCAVAIDDWHHADASSRGLLLSVAQRAGSPLRWCFSYRTSHMAAAAMAEVQALVDNAGAARIDVGPLDPAAVSLLVRCLSGSEAPRFATRLHQATGGNPFFLIETLRHLFEQGLVRVDVQGLWQTAFDTSTLDYRELPLPPTVRDAVRARVARLGEDTMRLLEAASLVGGPFSPVWLAGCTSLDENSSVTALETAERVHLLQRDGDGGRYRFTHDLVPQSLAAGLSPARTALLHRRLALALEHAQAGVAATATAIAQHWEHAGEPRRAVAWRLSAGQTAARLFLHREALAEFTIALANGPDRSQEVVIRHARIEALRHLGDVVARGTEAEALMALARACGDRNLEADAAIQRGLALADASLLREALRVLEHAVALDPEDPPTRLRALRIAGWAAMTCGETALAYQLLQRALPLAEHIDASAACSVLSTLLRLATDTGDYDQGQRLYDAARLHPALTLRPMIHQQVLIDGARLLEARGERETALAQMRQGLALADHAGAAPGLMVGRFNLMRMLFNGGDLAAAREMALAFAEVPSAESHPLRLYVALSAQVQLAMAEERWPEAVAAARRAVALCDGIDDPMQRRLERQHLSRSLLQCGELAAARDIAREALAIDADGRRVLLSAKAAEVDACLALEPQRADEWLLQIEQALAAPPMPEEERRAALEQAWLTRARLLQALGRHGDAAAAVRAVGFTPELRAQALTLLLQAPGQAEDQALAAGEALALLQGGRLAQATRRRLELLLAAG